MNSTATDEAVFRWRFSQLARSGYAFREATRLALHTNVDLHRAVDLVRRGCPPPLAVRILL